MAITTNSEVLVSLFSRLGIVVGTAVNTKVSEALDLSGVDIEALKQRLNTLESILDADPNTPEFDAAQNIITQLTNLTKRLDNAENPAVAGSLANQIAGLVSQLVALSAVVDQIKRSVGLQSDGTIVLPASATDATGELSYLYNDDGTPAANLLEAVKLFAKKAGHTLQDILNAVSDLQGRMTAAESAIGNLQEGVSGLQEDVAELRADLDAIDQALSVDELVAAFCQGVNGGLSGTTDPNCTIAGTENSGNGGNGGNGGL